MSGFGAQHYRHRMLQMHTRPHAPSGLAQRKAVPTSLSSHRKGHVKSPLIHGHETAFRNNLNPPYSSSLAPFPAVQQPGAPRLYLGTAYSLSKK